MTTDAIITDFLDDLAERVSDSLPDIRQAILESGKQFAADSALDLRRWHDLVATGTLSSDDLAWLVQSRIDLARMAALRDAGLSLARIDALRAQMAHALTGSVLKAAGIG